MLLLGSSVVWLALLQAAITEGIGTTTSSSAVPTQTVSVGAEGLVFTPDSITAAVGEVVEFCFYPNNHSVTRSEYKTPCIPYEVSGPSKQGFWSGFRPLNVDPANGRESMKVNDTKPIFSYCSSPGACMSNGMVGVINPNQNETLEIQKQYVLNSSLAFSPGEGFPIESSSTRTSTTASPTSSQTVTPDPTGSTSAAPPSSTKHHLSGGGIAGICIGSVVVGIPVLGSIGNSAQFMQSLSDYMDGPKIKVTVGDMQFKLLKDLLCSNSSFFDNAFNELLDFLKLADHIALIGLFDSAVELVKGIVTAHSKALLAHHIREGIELPSGHPLRVLFTEVSVKEYIPYMKSDDPTKFRFKKELDELDSFAADFPRVFNKSLAKVYIGRGGAPILDPLGVDGDIPFGGDPWS
ncbi:hypothetical protein B0J14DRAFT_652464 [Halenospora varia]|nr:hypothetical protein B0J14DRAFT_652464 [Halenospora varia]